jgi:hypothetical protein
MFLSSLCGNIIEGATAGGVTGAVASPRLPAPYRGICMEWI